LIEPWKKLVEMEHQLEVAEVMVVSARPDHFPFHPHLPKRYVFSIVTTAQAFGELANRDRPKRLDEVGLLTTSDVDCRCSSLVFGEIVNQPICNHYRKTVRGTSYWYTCPESFHHPSKRPDEGAMVDVNQDHFPFYKIQSSGPRGKNWRVAPSKSVRVQ
jgi:hypothetical protein